MVAPSAASDANAGQGVVVLGEGDSLPDEGIVVVPLKLAKGLEFDRVVIPDASARTFPESDIARRRLYTTISRATRHLTILSNGDLTERFRIAMSKKQSLTMRSLHYYWLATRNHLGLFVALVASTIGSAFLTYGNPYVMSLIVDRISADPVAPEAVFDVFGSYIAALIGINLTGQTCSKLQDYTLWKLQIAVNYDLATMAFDCLCNQSLSFHSNRFGGTLVSQTSKFMAGYTQLLNTMNFPFLPILCSITFTCLILFPVVPAYAAVLMAMLAVYAVISYLMYKRILHLNEKAASAQNQLSGELSDAVTNILAVKTYGREDYERRLFDTANREVVARDSKRMRASLARGITTAAITVVIMSVVTVVHLRRQRLVRHHAGHGHPHVHLHEHGDEPVQLHQYRPAAHQPGLRRCKRHDGGARRAAVGGR